MLCRSGRNALSACVVRPNGSGGSHRSLLWRAKAAPPPYDLLFESPDSMNVQPLTGTRVIDLTRVLSGPFSTMLLADMGADVVKVETPQGDTVRSQGEVVNGLSW